MRKFIARVSVVVFCAVGTLFVAHSPAAAAWSECEPGIGCVWDGSNGTGAIKRIPVSQHQVGHCYNFSTAWNNKVSSAQNGYGPYNGHKLALYLFTATCNQSGTYYDILYPGERTSFTGAGNNSFSSFAIIETTIPY
jgi:hypothetical protein